MLSEGYAFWVQCLNFAAIGDVNTNIQYKILNTKYQWMYLKS